VAGSVLEVADIVRSHRVDYEAARNGRVTHAERKVLRAIETCRTQALGGHVDECDNCGHQVISYNSCRNRHCPKCQASVSAEWVDERQEDLLPVPYFHVVFTVPREIAAVAQQNKKLVYGILFQSSAEAIREIAAHPKHLGVEVGVVAVLHTWGQRLDHHPHIHCLIPGGGLSPDRSRWLSSRPSFFLPVRVLGSLFRGKFLHRLRKSFERGDLVLKGGLSSLASPAQFRSFAASLYERKWVVYSKPPFGGPDRVLKYLARYTHRVAIANSRLVELKDGRVYFIWKDYAHKGRRRVMNLGAVEFLRRFLLHILPKGFVRIRHYGFLANRCRKERLELCQKLLRAQRSQPLHAAADETHSTEETRPCPACRQGRMLCVEVFEAGESPSKRRVPSPDDST